MKTITFINIKGGVGKSTASTIVAQMLAKVYNQKVLLIDVDGQCNTSNRFSAVDMLTLQEYAFKGQFDFPDESVYKILEDENYDPVRAIKETKYENLYIIPSAPNLTNLESKLLSRVSAGDFAQGILKYQISKIKDDFDVCIIDCSPSKNIINTNAIAASDVCYIPFMGEPDSSIGLAMAIQYIETVSRAFNTVRFGGAFLNGYNRLNADKAQYELVKDFLGEKLIPVQIPLSKLAKEVVQKQCSLLEHDPKESSSFTKAFLDLTRFVYEDIMKQE